MDEESGESTAEEVACAGKGESQMEKPLMRLSKRDKVKHISKGTISCT